MFEIALGNNKKFYCDENTTIFDDAKNANILLEHSCLSARCRSCAVKIISGQTQNVEDELVLTGDEKKQNYVLSCNAKPLSDLILDIEDLGDVTIFSKKIVPSKIDALAKLTDTVLKVTLRLPPTANYNFNAGQYVNLIKGELVRSYSIANSSTQTNNLEFFIKKYENGLMSKYWFEEAKIDDLLRIEGPLGSFFLRKTNCTNIVRLVTGTGVAPIKSILESLNECQLEFLETKFWVIVGARYEEDIFWNAPINSKILNLKYIPVLSKPNDNWKGEKGYVQDVVLKIGIDLNETQVYACGSNAMIESAKKLLFQNSLKEKQFFSDAFVETN